MSNGNQGLHGLRVLSLESRRKSEMAKLIEGHGGIAIIAPSMREIPMENNPEALAFARDLLDGRFDAVIFLTGVGTRFLFGAIEAQYPRPTYVEALSRVLVIARGPKPVAVLREFGVPIAIAVPEPNTWRDLLRTLDEHTPRFDLKGKSVAVQEYGASNQDLLEGLRSRGARVTAVKVYQWALPEDLEPMRQAVREIAEGKIDVLLVTSAAQARHLMQVAAEQRLEDPVLRGLQRAVVASIGPVSSETLQSFGIVPDFEPSHPKMGQLVFEAGQRAKALLESKRRLSEQAPSG